MFCMGWFWMMGMCLHEDGRPGRDTVGEETLCLLRDMLNGPRWTEVVVEPGLPKRFGEGLDPERFDVLNASIFKTVEGSLAPAISLALPHSVSLMLFPIPRCSCSIS